MNSIEKLLESHPQYILARQICQELHQAGYQAYLAGGCVRDVLLSRIPNDFDIATSATPDQVEQLFPKQTVPVGKEFGVMIVRGLEVATFRDDGPYIDGRRPQSVQFSQAERDAERRDFTVNALFYDFQNAKVIDYVGGLGDLQGRWIRAVGDPERRFAEDHLRLLRAVRFVSQLDFQIEEKTWNAVCAKSALVSTVSGERVFHELSKLIMGKSYQQGLKLLCESGLLSALRPQSDLLDLKCLSASFDSFAAKADEAQELTRWCDFFLWTARVFAFELSADPKILDFYRQWLDALKMPKDLRKKILRALSWIWQQPSFAGLSSQEQYGLLLESSFDPENLWGMSRRLSLCSFTSQAEKDLFMQWKKWWDQCALVMKPKAVVSASDLEHFFKAKGLESPRGEDLGRALRFCFQQQLLFPNRTRDELLQSYLERQ